MFKFPSFNVRTGKHGMQPKLLCPRRSRFAPKTQRWEIPNFKNQIPKKMEGNLYFIGWGMLKSSID